MVCISQMALQRKGKQRLIDSHAQSPKGHSSSLFARSRPQRDQQSLNYTYHHTIKYANWRGTENPLDRYNCWFFCTLFLVSLLLHISQEIYFVSFGLQSTSPSCSAVCRYWKIPTFVRTQPEPKKNSGANSRWFNISKNSAVSKFTFPTTSELTVSLVRKKKSS